MFGDTSDNLIQRMKNVYIPYNCQFLLVEKINGSFYEINEIYNIRGNSERYFIKIGYWSHDEGLKMASGSFYQRRLNMQGTKLPWNLNYEVRNIIILCKKNFIIFYKFFSALLFF